jgi:hypothetical protein
MNKILEIKANVDRFLYDLLRINKVREYNKKIQQLNKNGWMNTFKQIESKPGIWADRMLKLDLPSSKLSRDGIPGIWALDFDDIPD